MTKISSRYLDLLETVLLDLGQAETSTHRRLCSQRSAARFRLKREIKIGMKDIKVFPFVEKSRLRPIMASD